MNANKMEIAENCYSSINRFVTAVRPSRYSTDNLKALELLDAETKLNQCWDDFCNLSASGWASVRSQMSRIDQMYLWYYALRMAEMAVRRSDENFIRFGMMALVVDEKYTDARDVYIALTLLLDAAKRINADYHSLIENTASFASSKRRHTIVNYVEECDDEASMDQILEGMGYSTSGSKETFRYFSTV